MKTTRTPIEYCRRCGHKLDAATAVDKPEATPKAGDASICWGCGLLSIFTADLTRRDPTPTEMIDLISDPTLRAAADLIERRGPL